MLAEDGGEEEPQLLQEEEPTGGDGWPLASRDVVQDGAQGREAFVPQDLTTAHALDALEFTRGRAGTSTAMRPLRPQAARLEVAWVVGWCGCHRGDSEARGGRRAQALFLQ